MSVASTGFMGWALNSDRKNEFLSVFSTEIETMMTEHRAVDFSPTTPEKMSLWEAYCAATNQDSSLPGNEAPVYREETPPR